MASVKSRFIISYLAFLMLPQAAILFGQARSTLYTIHGNVKLPSGLPAARVTVNVTSLSGSGLQTVTDGMGRFEVRGLPRGRYYLTAKNPLAEGQYAEPVEADFSRGNEIPIIVNIHLRSTAEPEPAQEGRRSSITVGEAAQRIPKPARKAYDLAMKFRFKQDYDHAIKSLDQSIELFPAYFQALAERGYLYLAKGRMDEALADFARALELNGGYEPGLRGMGLCRFRQGRFDECIKSLSSAAQAEPGNALTHLFLGIACLALDQRDASRAALQKALSIDPKAAVRAHIHLGNIWIKEDRPVEAIHEFEAYLAAVPDAPDAARLRALEAQLRARTPKP